MPARLAWACDGGQAPGALHHIICRGIERRNIFKDNTDRNRFKDGRWQRLPKGLQKTLALKKTKRLSLENNPIGYVPVVFWLTGWFGTWAWRQRRLASTSGWSNPLSVGRPIEAKNWSSINSCPWRTINASFQPCPLSPSPCLMKMLPRLFDLFFHSCSVHGKVYWKFFLTGL